MRRLLVTTLLATPLLVQAWGADGHQTVGAIAAGLIKGTPVEARVAALLGDMPLPLAAIWADCAKGISPAQPYTYPTPGKYAECAALETPERIAEMADYVRRNDRQCKIGMDEDSCHKQTHYADVPLQRSRYLPGFTGTRPDDVVGALRQAILVLQGRPTTGQPNYKSQREALLVLAHLVGDVHQPLHVGAAYLDATGRRVDPDKTGFDPASFTVGGNSLFVVAAPKPAAAQPELAAAFGPLKMHSLWDGVPDRLKPGRVDAAWLAQARKVHANRGDPADWPARWATQSLEEAGVAFEGLSFSPKEGSHWNVSLPGGYSAKAEAIKREQLTLAGARLAAVLKAVFPK
ncbi:S1/P1 nuclease [Pelomonas sp. P7]|uniref:S1/P1 nuclease n=1 Tax=Pelomonas caseinilytica TaxID=2906763 RepID=A0ABS8XAL8_9BURK|nr:S1/P1 nuclease [Pelomonas sp. P7]MCE4537962.1 S1/P1 nuclease [Pelomonas sp. P7]